MTKQQKYLTEQKALVQQKLDALKKRQRILEAREEALARKRLQARYVVVGKLVEAAGLLWADDSLLEKLLAETAATPGKGSDETDA